MDDKLKKDKIEQYIEIEGVEAGSIAQELGLGTGDRIFRINGQAIKDFIDYKFLITDNYLEVEVIKNNGEYWVLDIEKDYDQSLGIQFSEIIFDGLKKCHNKCIFCFVDQAPIDCRKTLNLKDDDYRFSFLEGSYITLTNLSDEEFNRIKSLHLSPLNISVHSTNPETRRKMLNNKQAGRILEQIEELVERGIELNTQVVLCPGVNDGQYLEETIKDLAEFIPEIKSLAIVPVGLTKYRDNLYNLRSFTAQEAKNIINLVKKWQTKFKAEFGINFVYLSDEFYLLAQRGVPATAYYDQFPQLENGVGMVRTLLDQFYYLEDNLAGELTEGRQVSVVTGVLGAMAIKPIVDRLNQIDNLELNLIEIENKYFGSDVTVTGLLTGKDILAALQEEDKLGDIILVPDILLNKDDLFLDNLSWNDFSDQLSTEVIRVKNEADDFINKALGNNFGGDDNDKTSSSDCR